VVDFGRIYHFVVNGAFPYHLRNIEQKYIVATRRNGVRLSIQAEKLWAFPPTGKYLGREMPQFLGSVNQ
jgi:hypothetical protein